MLSKAVNRGSLDPSLWVFRQISWARGPLESRRNLQTPLLRRVNCPFRRKHLTPSARQPHPPPSPSEDTKDHRSVCHHVPGEKKRYPRLPGGWVSLGPLTPAAVGMLS